MVVVNSSEHSGGSFCSAAGRILHEFDIDIQRFFIASIPLSALSQPLPSRINKSI